MNKEHKVWMLWFQGKSEILQHPINRHCYISWLENSDSFNFTFLDSDNLSDYLPEYSYIIANSPFRKLPAKSDLIRILLLEKFGGTWVDASVFCNSNFEKILDQTVNDTNLFLFRFRERLFSSVRGDRIFASWYITSSFPHNKIIQLWKQAFISKFTDPKFKWKYYTFHDSLVKLYDTNVYVKNVLDSMNQIAPCKCLSARDNPQKRDHTSYMYKRPNNSNIAELVNKF